MHNFFLQKIGLYFVVSLVLGSFALVGLYPFHPITLKGWLYWFAVIPPFYLLLEWLGSFVFPKKLGEAVDPNVNAISAGRVSLGVALVLISLGLFYIILLIGLALTDRFLQGNFSSVW